QQHVVFYDSALATQEVSLIPGPVNWLGFEGGVLITRSNRGPQVVSNTRRRSELQVAEPSADHLFRSLSAVEARQRIVALGKVAVLIDLFNLLFGGKSDGDWLFKLYPPHG